MDVTGMLVSLFESLTGTCIKSALRFQKLVSFIQLVVFLADLGMTAEIKNFGVGVKFHKSAGSEESGDIPSTWSPSTQSSVSNGTCGHVQPILEDNSWVCKDSSLSKCIFVRGNGDKRICAQCCEGRYFDYGLCSLCGPCRANNAVVKEVCSSDGNANICMTSEDPVLPNNCTVNKGGTVSENEKIGIGIGVLCGVVIMMMIIGVIYRRRRRGNRRQRVPAEPQVGIEYGPDNRREDELRRGDEGGMTDIRAENWDDAIDPRREINAPGYDNVLNGVVS